MLNKNHPKTFDSDDSTDSNAKIKPIANQYLYLIQFESSSH